MWLQSRIVFFKKLFKQPFVNASITPSSRYLSKAMLKDIDFSHIHTVIEFGPGTGVFTKFIINNVHPTTKIICLEFDWEYVKLLHNQYGHRIILEHTSVANLTDILTKHAIAKPDLIISWLPYSAYNISLMKDINLLIKLWTIFRWFSYTPHQFRDIYKELPLVQKSFVLRNIPPAFVFGAN